MSRRFVPISAAGLQGLALRTGARRVRKEADAAGAGPGRSSRVRVVRAGGIGPALRPSADLPSREAACLAGRCRRFGKTERARSVGAVPLRPPFNGQLRTGTDKGNPTV
ncbi:hypothetical protein EVAR_47555_1 [Eumeta japonica]|uniref:Uncharacterized protein n=1 Tax=Eumeta variegata TaxID=151549 RepID=A0A4C1WPX4_EUMVA|nr:hypothetical protein EVAR_47555_1 [Eumeta japonica]